MQSGALEENPVQDTWAALHCQWFRKKSTVDFQLKLNAFFCCEHSVSFWVCLSLCFLKIRLCWVQVQFFGQLMYSDCGTILLNAPNASFRFPKLSVNSKVYCSVWENKPPLHSGHNVGECTSVVSEQNSVLDGLAALLAHSQFCRNKSSVEMSWIWCRLVVNASFCCEHSVQLWVCLSQVFSEFVLFCVPMKILGQIA